MTDNCDGGGRVEVPVVQQQALHKSSDPALDQLREDVHKLIHIMGSDLGAELHAVELPEVAQSSKRNAYDRQINTIAIRPDSFKRGRALSEEAAHFLRSRLKDKEGRLDTSSEAIIDEFFGGLGEPFARRASQDTDLAPLFEQDEESDSSTPATLDENIAEQIQQGFTNIAALRDEIAEHEDSRTKRIEMQNSLTLMKRELKDIGKILRTIQDMVDEKTVSLADAKKDIGVLAKRFFDVVSRVVNETDIEFSSIKNAVQNWDDVSPPESDSSRNIANSLLKCITPELVSRNLLMRQINTLRLGVSSLETQIMMQEACLLSETYKHVLASGHIMDAEQKLQIVLAHVVGYELADQYVKDNPDTWIESLPELFRAPSELLFERLKVQDRVDEVLAK